MSSIIIKYAVYSAAVFFHLFNSSLENQSSILVPVPSQDELMVVPGKASGI